MDNVDWRNCRLTDETCPDCGEPLGEALTPGGEWVRGECLVCWQQEMRESFIQSVRERRAERAALHQHATFENFQASLPHQVRGLKAAREFVENVKRKAPIALVMYAYARDGHTGYGTGKTHLASAVSVALARAGWDVQAWASPEMMTQIKSTYGQDGEGDEWAIIQRATECDLLILDDVGKEYFRDPSWYQEKVFMIVNARSQRGPMVVTTNLRPEDLSGWIGGAALSRLWQMCGQGDESLLVDMCGPDYRFVEK